MFDSAQSRVGQSSMLLDNFELVFTNTTEYCNKHTIGAPPGFSMRLHMTIYGCVHPKIDLMRVPAKPATAF